MCKGGKPILSATPLPGSDDARSGVGVFDSVKTKIELRLDQFQS